MPDYFTLSEIREAYPDIADDTRYSDDLVERAAGYITAIIERAVGTSFVPRTMTKTLNGPRWDVALPAYIREVTSVEDGGTILSGPLTVADGTVAGLGAEPVTVTYTVGYSETPPDDIKEAAMQGTAARVLSTASNSRLDDRTSQTTNESGGTTTFVLPGVDRPTGYPDVDAVILGWRRRLFGFGFI